MGRVLALGTRYLVRLHDDRVRVVVNDGAVRIEPPPPARRARVGWRRARAPGSTRAARPSGPAMHEDAWLQGALYADNMRLDAFIAELGRYRRGRLACDPAVAGLRISGSFLADTDRALAAVERALPVQVLRYTRYWVVLRGRA